MVKSGIGNNVLIQYVRNNDVNYATWNPFHWEYREFFCGWVSAFINISVTYPINKVIFRQMLHNLTPISAVKQLSNEGVWVLYRGILPPLCQKTTSLALMFGVYDVSRKPLGTILPENVAKASAAIVAGTTEAILTPFERIQTLLQDQKYQKQFKNTRDAFYQIRFSYGFREYYRGLVPILLRNGPSNCFYFFLRDEAKDRVSNRDNSALSELVKEFLYGGLIGGFTSTVFYPLNVIKVQQQSRLGGTFQSITSSIMEIYRERGNSISYFYRGVHLNYTRGFISWGVITATSETIKKYIY